MDSLLFPTTIVDNFLDQPHKYVEFANSLEYLPDPNGKWPGVRSVNLSEHYPQMVNRIITKITSLFYNFENQQDNLNWESLCYFQKVSSTFNSGWVHSDNMQLTSIIYFCEPGYGTSIYLPKDITIFNGLINSQKKFESYKNTDCIMEYQKYKDHNNGLFDKTISVDSKFNRCFLFESQNFHCADNFINKDDNTDRLTMIFFIDNLCSNNFPIQRSKQG